MTMTVTGSSRSRISLIRSRPLIPGKSQVGQHQRARVLDQPFQGGGAVGRNRDLPVGMGKKLRKLLADQLAVIHHEDASFHGALIRVEVGSHPGRAFDPPAFRRVRSEIVIESMRTTRTGGVKSSGGANS